MSAALQWRRDSVTTKVATVITKSFLRDRIQWADNVPTGFIPPQERNRVGLAWLMLVRCGILKRVKQEKPSADPKARGRRVRKFRLASESLAREFLEINGDFTPRKGQFPLL